MKPHSILWLWFCAVLSVCASPDPKPNILFIVLDDWGWREAGAYGSTWVKTPSFDRIAREGALFTNAFTSNPKCSPCRASILTGRNSWQLREGNVHYSDFPSGFPVYPDLLADAGYAIGHTGKGWGPGRYDKAGFTANPAGPVFNNLKLAAPTTGIHPIDYAGNFEAFLNTRDGRPFCFWLGPYEPHRVYETGSGQRSGRDPGEVTLPGYFPDDDIVRSDLLDYGLEVEHADRQIGRALHILETQGLLENTLIVMTSDHGMPFPRVKAQIWEDGFHLPLAIRWGRQLRAGLVIDNFINVRDFAPTFLAAAGVPIPKTMTGRNLLPLLTSEAQAKPPKSEFMLIGKERHDVGRPGRVGYPVRAIRTREWLYVRNYEPSRWPAGNPETGYRNVDDGPTKRLLMERQDRFYDMAFGFRPEEMLYDIENDPECLTNLISQPANRVIADQLCERMEDELRAEHDPRMLGYGEVFDLAPYYGKRDRPYEAWLRERAGWSPRSD